MKIFSNQVATKKIGKNHNNKTIGRETNGVNFVMGNKLKNNFLINYIRKEGEFFVF